MVGIKESRHRQPYARPFAARSHRITGRAERMRKSRRSNVNARRARKFGARSVSHDYLAILKAAPHDAPAIRTASCSAFKLGGEIDGQRWSWHANWARQAMLNAN